jgi:hypothetical protein
MMVPFELGHDRVEAVALTVAVVVAEKLVEVVDVVMSVDVVVRYELELDDGDVILVASVEDKIEELPGEDDVSNEEDVVEFLDEESVVEFMTEDELEEPVRVANEDTLDELLMVKEPTTEIDWVVVGELEVEVMLDITVLGLVE